MSLMLNDYSCPRHGVFEGSHPICPAMGCNSEGVSKVFLKAPGIRSDYTRRFDEGMKRNAEVYKQTDWKSAEEGENAKANNRADELLWGERANAMLGGNAVQLAAKSNNRPAAALGLVSGMSPLTQAERTGMKKEDDAWRAKLKQEIPTKAA